MTADLIIVFFFLAAWAGVLCLLDVVATAMGWMDE